jgi:CRP-like cAMP-binding protein
MQFRSGLESHNQILAALPSQEFQALLPHLKLISLELGQVLQKNGDSLDYIYFPLDSVISSIATTEENKSVEVSVHGPEGAQGIEALLSPGTASSDAIVRAPGRALRIREYELHPVFSRHGVLRERLMRYTLYVLRQVTQSAVCLRMHGLKARLCRWLLMGSDRDSHNAFPMNCELLASMLGTSQPEVRAAVTALRKANLIDYRPESVSILNRAGLERIVCECYRMVHAEFIHFGRNCTLTTTPDGLQRFAPPVVAMAGGPVQDYAPVHTEATSTCGNMIPGDSMLAREIGARSSRPSSEATYLMI